MRTNVGLTATADDAGRTAMADEPGWSATTDGPERTTINLIQMETGLMGEWVDDKRLDRRMGKWVDDKQ